jgi:glycosidase
MYIKNYAGENNIGSLLHLAVGSNPLANAGSPLTPAALKEALDAYRQQLPAQAWPALALSSAPADRVASSQGADMVDPLNMLTLLLPGTPLPLFGDELGRFLRS